MNNQSPKRKLTRRDFIKIGGGTALTAAGIRYLPQVARNAFLSSATSAEAATKTFHLVGTDGFIYLPGPAGGITANNPVRTVYPDPLAPNGRTTYIFGFRDVTTYSTQNVLNQKGKAQASAPLLWVDELDDVKITLTNLGLQIRPDLFDSHTIHFHGFRNAIPLFDGVPEMSIAVPISSDFTYYYKPRDAGTYMYHCHFEDVEHVQMGMTGIVYVRPAQNKGVGTTIPKSRLAEYGGLTTGPMGYAYNDGVAPGQPGSTAYDREFGMFLTEIWAAAHYDDAHIQVSDWSEYEPDFWTLNGRCYPDTLATGPANGDPGATDNSALLQYQPISSLVTCNAGEKVLLRFVSLGYQQAAMTLDSITMRVVGKDATLLRGFNAAGTLRTGADLSYDTDTVYIGPGESYDAIFTAPAFDQPAATAAGTPNSNAYLLYNRAYAQMTNGGAPGMGGQVTEVRVYPATGTTTATSGPRPKQTRPNT